LGQYALHDIPDHTQPRDPPRGKDQGSHRPALIFVYIISPIDIIPEFIPLAGWLDDLIVIPVGFALLRHFTPGVDVAETQNRSKRSIKRIILWTILALAGLVLFFLGSLALIIYLIVKLISG
jgi:hypothetical protein